MLKQNRRKSRRTFSSVILLIVPLLLFTAGYSPASPIEMPLLETPRDLPDIEFFDESNNTITLDKWKGKLIVLNIWATWCGPCRTEMPTLDRLQGKLGSDKFEVVALSIDEVGLRVVQNFFKSINIENLDIYIDPSYQAAGKLRASGLPATILINPNGQELGRLVGPAEWDTPQMIAFFENVLDTQF